MAIRLRRAPPVRPVTRRSRRHARATVYRRTLVALSPAEVSAQAVQTACALAADHGAEIAAVAAIEVPLDVALEEPADEARAAAREAVRAAQAMGATYGVGVDGVVLHARDAGEAIVAEAVARTAELVVLAVPPPRGRAGRIGRTSGHVLEHAPCRVLLIADTAAAEPAFRPPRPASYWPAGEFVDADGATRR